METDTVESDKGIGLAMLFSMLAGVGAAVMLVAGMLSLQQTTAWGFALAMVAAVVAVVAAQLYW
jgi:hypothetical protein